MSWSRILGVVVLAGLLSGACTPNWGDPGAGVWFRNESDSPVIIQFIDRDGTTGTGFAVAAKTDGGSYVVSDQTGTWSARVRVVTPDACRVVWQEDVRSSPSGVLVVDASGAVSLVTSGPEVDVPASEVPLRSGSETQDCLPKGVLFAPEYK